MASVFLFGNVNVCLVGLSSVVKLSQFSFFHFCLVVLCDVFSCHIFIGASVINLSVLSLCLDGYLEICNVWKRSLLYECLCLMLLSALLI